MHFNYFPKEEHLREKWKIALRVGKKITNSDRVFKDHFLSTDYIPQAAPTTKRRLKKTAIPSQKIPIRSHDRIETTPQKKKKEARRKRVEARKLLLSVDDGGSPTSETSESDTAQATDLENPFTGTAAETSSLPPPAEVILKERSCQTDKFSILTLLSDKSKLCTFTGLSSEQTLEKIANCALKIAPESARKVLPMRERVALCLIKLKLNLTYTALAVLVGISDKTGSNYFKDTVRILAQVLKGLIYLPSREETLRNMPKCFRQFWRTRIVLDCAEIPLEKLKCMKERIMSYSHYKGRHTVKFCVGVTPAGLICFVSKCFGGRASDKRIVVHSEILSKLDFGDAVMVDKGFMIEDECFERHLVLVRPPFLSKKKSLSKAETLRTAEIARARVHVERVINRLRNFDILVNQVPTTLLPYINDIITICAALVNLTPPVLAIDKF